MNLPIYRRISIVRLILLLSIFLHFQALIAQNHAVDWVKDINGSNLNSLNKIDIDLHGNIYATGYFYETVDFDPGKDSSKLTSTRAGYVDAYVAKYSKSGNLIWVRQFSSDYHCSGLSLTIDNQGNCIASGIFQYYTDFDLNSKSHELKAVNRFDGYVVKLDSLGNTLWAKQIGGRDDDRISNVKTDKNANIYITGRFIDSVDLDPSTQKRMFYGNGGDDIFIAKLNSKGEYVWGYSFGGSENDGGVDVAVDNNGEVTFAGYFRKEIDFDPRTSQEKFSADKGDIFLIHLSSSGTYKWAKHIGGLEDQIVRTIEYDNAGNFYISGEVSGKTDFDPASGTYYIEPRDILGAHQYDVYVAKYSPQGKYIWANQIVGEIDDRCYDLSIDEQNNVYLTGEFQWNADFDPSSSRGKRKAVGRDGYVAIYDKSGSYINSYQFKSEVISVGHSIVAKNGEIITAGYFAGTVDFDPGEDTISIETNKYLEDFFIHKMKECDNYVFDTIIACDQFISPSGMSVTKTGTFQDTIPNRFGCDSIITFELTILSSSSSIDTIEACDSFWWKDSTYYVSTDSAFYIIPNSNGCDSTIKLHLTINSTNVDTKIDGNEIQSEEGGALYQWLDCEKNYALIPNETNQVFTPISSGNYAVELTKANCTDTSQCVMFQHVSVQDPLSHPLFEMYPNPTSGLLSIKTHTVRKYLSIEVTNEIGQTVSRHEFSMKGDVTIRIREKGVYIVRIFDGENVFGYERVVRL